jgi:hypothetical protein
MVRNIFVPIIAMVAIGAGALAIRAMLSSPKAESADPQALLYIAPEQLQLAGVWEDDRFIRDLIIENREPNPVEIEKFSFTCSCSSIEPPSLTLQPGDRRNVRLTIDLTASARGGGEAGVLVTALLKAGSLGGKRYGPEWLVTGRIRRAVTVARTFELGRYSELAAPLGPWTIPVRALVPLDKVSAQCDLRGISVSVRPPDAGSADYSIALQANARLPIGDLEGEVTLNLVGKGGESIPARRVLIRGAVVPDIESEPSIVQVGVRRIGESFAEEIALRSLTGRKLGRARAEADGQGLKVEPIGAGNRFLIRQTVVQPGTQVNRVRLFVEMGGRNEAVTLPVEYTGIASE